MSVVRRTIQQTLTAVELNKEQTLELTLSSGDIWKLEVVDTGAEAIPTTRKDLHFANPGTITVIHFHADVKINGKPRSFEREISSQRSFYEPWVVDGVRIWLDAVDDAFDFMDVQTCHMVELTFPEHQSIKKGTQYAVGAGVWVGAVEHSHFIFKVYDDGNLYLLDPWMLFWQMYRDEEQKTEE